MPGDHLYTTDPAGELAPAAGYELEGPACHVFGRQIGASQPLFRWFHPNSGDHFYTLDANGEAAPQAGYSLEGVQCYVFSLQQANTVPLFRWFHSGSGDHFYTTDPNGELAPAAGYAPEGIACYVYSQAQSNSVPLFRWFQNGFMSNFGFDPAISQPDRLRVLQRHAFAHFRAKQCTNISAQERTDVINAYGRAMQHGISTNPNVNAEATIGGNQMWINFGNLFPLGDREIAQTLLHEMMHIAGYTHPPKTSSDVPGDNGPYYGSPPLRAELCIAGIQSDAGLITLARIRPEVREHMSCCSVE